MAGDRTSRKAMPPNAAGCSAAPVDRSWRGIKEKCTPNDLCNVITGARVWCSSEEVLMAIKQIDRNKKYLKANEEIGMVAVKVVVPQTKRKIVISLAKQWREEIKK